MTQADTSLIREIDASQQLRLRTLTRLRWLAVCGQTAAVIFVAYGLNYALPIGPCLALIALSAWLNVYFAVMYHGSPRLTSAMAALLLGYDVLQLAGLLYLTGGLANPFSFLFLVPVTVSATSLPLRATLLLGGMAFACATLLAFYHMPLPWPAGTLLDLPPIYLAGFWVAIACGTVFSAIYARRIAEEARQMSAALSATEMVLAQGQRLSALDGLAAAAAHELGSPLATIALVAKELQRATPQTSEHREDIDLLISQTARCREILARLSNRDQAQDHVFSRVSLPALMEDLAAPLRGSDVAIVIACAEEGNVAGAEPVFLRNPAISYGIGNILENAIDFAETKVSVQATWNRSSVTITITDDGPGFDPQVFDRLGDPFVTTRPGYMGEDMRDGGHEGMGLGLFIAKTLLERSGASVALSNCQPPERGARIVIQWPRSAVDLGSNPA
ncbi:MAG: ActS/PrrB/RegB family redox-sensitive histidine kinase [Hyphomicrobiales bacterium]